MSNLNDETQETFTGVASSAQSGTVEVNTSDNGESVVCFITADGGGDPGDVTVIAERYSEAQETWYEYGRNSLTSNGNERSVTDEAIPSKMRYSVINDTAGSQSYRLTAVSF